MSASLTAAPSLPQRLATICVRRYSALAAGLLLLAALNLSIRLGSEVVGEWDEAMYALTASEMVDRGDWVGTTIHGQLDYYNAKPPLNVWLIGLSFKAFGKSLISLRLASAVSAWLTLLVLMIWVRRCFGPVVALVSGAVLATNFGFIYVHAGRSADPDALLTLLILLSVVTLWAARAAAWRLIWLGPIMAGVFLLRGMAILMPLTIVVLVEAWRQRTRPGRWIHVLLGVPLFIWPVGVWAVLRWRIDEWRFLRHVVYDDFIGHAFQTLDGHQHSSFFYVNILQKHEYAWLFAAITALILVPPQWSRWRAWLRSDGEVADRRIVLTAWAAVTLLVPSMMGSKLPWYLNSFYPAFAVGTGWILARAFSDARLSRRHVGLGLLVALVFLAAESRLIWYSFTYRTVASSRQGLMLSEHVQLKGRVVYGQQWENADAFVLRGLIRAETQLIPDPDAFVRCSSVGDYLLWSSPLSRPGLSLVGANGNHWLYRRDQAGVAVR